MRHDMANVRCTKGEGEEGGSNDGKFGTMAKKKSTPTY